MRDPTSFLFFLWFPSAVDAHATAMAARAANTLKKEAAILPLFSYPFSVILLCAFRSLHMTGPIV